MSDPLWVTAGFLLLMEEGQKNVSRVWLRKWWMERKPDMYSRDALLVNDPIWAISWEKCTYHSSPFFCFTSSYSETAQRDRMEFFLPCFPSAVLAFSLDSTSVPFCLKLPVLIPLHFSFILTYSNSFTIVVPGGFSAGYRTSLFLAWVTEWLWPIDEESQ